MKRLIAIVSLGLSSWAVAAPPIEVGGPDGRLRFALFAGESRLEYTIRAGERTVLAPSPLGVVVDGADLGRTATLGRVETYGADETYPTRGTHSRAVNRFRGARVSARFRGQPISYTLRQSGSHWGLMSLAALLMMEALGVPLADGLVALAAFEPLEGRGAEADVAIPGGAFTLIDESYNANPVSTAAALRTLGLKPARRRIASRNAWS